MPRLDITSGSPCWIDLVTSEPARSQKFYGALFGWTFVAGDEEKYGGYVTAFKDGQLVAGIMAKDAGTRGVPDMWSMYLKSEDLTRTAAAVEAHSGQIFMAPMDVPEQGRMAFFADATGAAIGAWEPAAMAGYQVTAEHGTPAWHELQAKDYPAAVKFYEEVFGWETHVLSETDDFRYTTLGAGDSAKAGIMDASGYLPAEAPSSWEIYFAVDSADQSISQAVLLGAMVVDAAKDTPFGRLATLTDPTGARFKLVQNLE